MLGFNHVITYRTIIGQANEFRYYVTTNQCAMYQKGSL